MRRERAEVINFARDDVEKILCHMAKLQIIGPMFVGKFGGQTVHWRDDGGVDVITNYEQVGLDEVISRPTPLPKQGRKK